MKNSRIAILVILLFACQTQKSASSQQVNEVMGNPAADIVEKYWKLIELNGRDVSIDSTFIKEPHIILKKSDNRIVGNGGCNNVSGEYKIENPNRITMSKIISTRMACPQMELESEFLGVLQKADNFNLIGDVLTLNKARMAPLAKFKVVYMK